MRVLLVTPPMTQLNTPYPATAYLTGFLRKHAPEVEVHQADLALELFLRLFSRVGLGEALAELQQKAMAAAVAARLAAAEGAAGEPPSPPRPRRANGRIRSRAGRVSRREDGPPPSVASFLAQADRYLEVVDPVVRFLQGADPSLALRIVGRSFLPEGPRFRVLEQGEDTLNWAFGALGVQDQAKYLASLFIDDLADVWRDGIDPRFELSRYGEKLAASAPAFDELAAAVAQSSTLVDRALDELTDALVRRHAPDLLGVTVPFPGNAYGAFRIARVAKRVRPALRVALGGGYVNTELRGLCEPRVFDDVDFITLDDGERPFLSLLAHLRDPSAPLFRTFVREGDRVVLRQAAELCDVNHRDVGAPTYQGLRLEAYVSLVEMLNPMHRLWSDGRWNKLTVAHGCYWKKCTFCDISLDYIGRYEVAPADELVDRIESLVRETGQTGFHFVDEAAPPAALRALAERLIARRVTISWWGNIRFEKTFTPELTQLLARSGCVAVSGGLEVASDRLLALMKKGVTVDQVARVTRAFTDAGVMVHAYLMYGFPTETEQETIDALERVRQLFEEGCLQSAFWHRFAATVHSPIGKTPELYGIRLVPHPRVTFADNERAFVDPVGCDHDTLGEGLRKALYNYMHGLGFDEDLRSWFATKGLRRHIPSPQVPRDLIQRALA